MAGWPVALNQTRAWTIWMVASSAKHSGGVSHTPRRPYAIESAQRASQPNSAIRGPRLKSEYRAHRGKILQ
jgi:hypothetical protein